MIECPREQDLLDALVSSRWPARCEPELRAHVETCPSCADTLAVALPLLAEGHEAYASARVPSSGIVWWRAQMRARQEAERAASRPITIVQGIACACVTALIAAAVYWMQPGTTYWREWLGNLTGAVGTTAVGLAHAGATPWGLLPWMALAVWLVLAPVAIYFAVTDD